MESHLTTIKNNDGMKSHQNEASSIFLQRVTVFTDNIHIMNFLMYTTYARAERLRMY